MSRRRFVPEDAPPMVGTEHLPLFAGGEAPALPVHAGDPPAAVRASLERATPASSQRAEAFRAVDAAGERGLVHTEVDDRCGWPGGSANRRLCELVALGQLVRLMVQRRTKHNAWAHIYVSARHVAGRKAVP
jgi:hypothetical protein